MHISFEDPRAKEGHVYRMDDSGNWNWEPVQKDRMDRPVYIAAVWMFGVVVPLAVALVLFLT